MKQLSFTVLYARTELNTNSRKKEEEEGNEEKNVTCNITDTALYSAGAGVAQSIRKPVYGMDDAASIFGRSNDGNFSLRHRVHTRSGAHTASYPMGTGGKAAGA
jgi:hypothetical protein